MGMRQKLRHENIVSLIEVFRRKGKLYLVFEYVDNTILEQLEKHPYGLDEIDVKKCTFQLLRGLEYCHSHNVNEHNTRHPDSQISAERTGSDHRHR